MSWEALGGDPAAGDEATVLAVAERFEAVRDGAEIAIGRLRGVDGGSGQAVWRGPASLAFRDELAKAGPALTRLAEAHDHAGSALRRYAAALEGAQICARRAETEAERALADRAAATARRNQADADADRSALAASAAQQRWVQGQTQRVAGIADPVYTAQLDTYLRTVAAQRDQAHAAESGARQQASAARAAENDASARLSAARAAGLRAKHDHDDAAHRLTADLRSALPPSGPWGFLKVAEKINEVAAGAEEDLRYLEKKVQSYTRDGKDFRRWDKGLGFLRRTFNIEAAQVEKLYKLAESTHLSKFLGVFSVVIAGAGAAHEQQQEDVKAHPAMSDTEHQFRDWGAGIAVGSLNGLELLAGNEIVEQCAAWGAELASVIPVLGTAVGAVVGAAIGVALSAAFDELVKRVGLEEAVRHVGAAIGTAVYDKLNDIAGSAVPTDVTDGAADTRGDLWKKALA